MKLKLRSWVKVAILLIVFLIACKIIQINFDKQDIKTQKEVVTRAILIEEIDKSIQTKQTFAYEPRNEFKVDVCSGGLNKTYMDYKMITNTHSKQYQFIKANMTVNEKGYLIDKDEYIGVALGSYFGKIGTRYIFKLSSGIELKVVKVEEKSNTHTNNGCEQKWDKSVIEFVIDSNIARDYYKTPKNDYVNGGNFNKVFNGKIIEIVQVK